MSRPNPEDCGSFCGCGEERCELEHARNGFAHVNLETLRELAPGFATAIERMGLQRATDARLHYLASDPRLLRDLQTDTETEGRRA